MPKDWDKQPSCAPRESDPVEDFINSDPDDGICASCDGTGQQHGHLCKDCGGKGSF